jgi:hypothetical protein
MRLKPQVREYSCQVDIDNEVDRSSSVYITTGTVPAVLPKYNNENDAISVVNEKRRWSYGDKIAEDILDINDDEGELTFANYIRIKRENISMKKQASS